MTPLSATTLYLVRHGEVHNPAGIIYGRLPGFGLSERGRRQIARAAEALQGFYRRRVQPVLAARRERLRSLREGFLLPDEDINEVVNGVRYVDDLILMSKVLCVD